MSGLVRAASGCGGGSTGIPPAVRTGCTAAICCLDRSTHIHPNCVSESGVASSPRQLQDWGAGGNGWGGGSAPGSQQPLKAPMSPAVSQRVELHLVWRCGKICVDSLAGMEPANSCWTLGSC